MHDSLVLETKGGDVSRTYWTEKSRALCSQLHPRIWYCPAQNKSCLKLVTWDGYYIYSTLILETYWRHLVYIYIYIYIYNIYIYIYINDCCRSKERIKIYFKIGRSTKRFVFFKNLFILFLHTCYICVYFQLVAFVREHIWHKAFLMGYSVRLELILVCSLNVFQSVCCGFYVEAILPFS